MGKAKIKIGIVGCGTIGSQLALAIEKRFADQATLLALFDIDKDKAIELKKSCSSDPKIVTQEALIATCDLIIEAASVQASYDVAKKALAKGKDVMIMSSGGILEKAAEIFELARKSNCRIYLPSGALCGLDAVKSAAMAKVNRATLTTRKPPKGLAGAPYLKEKEIDLSLITQETVIFEGNALAAIKGFPKNVNVCAALSLAGIGAEKTIVKIITSPEYKANMHEIQLEGDFGKLLARTENVASPNNPKTSYLASLSAIATLDNILGSVKIGT
ncbi:MAG: aspartate dehydrogenase [Candidatus Omnitrophica bacterium]|nr:aspartate dehydrogenase [Candidatus Omnitrophota bacterium]